MINKKDIKMELIRLQKYFTDCGVLSRRAAEEEIKAGRVKVNGKSVKPSFKIKIGDIVELGFNSGTVSFKVLMIKETVRKEEAENMFEIIKE